MISVGRFKTEEDKTAARRRKGIGMNEAGKHGEATKKDCLMGGCRKGLAENEVCKRCGFQEIEADRRRKTPMRENKNGLLQKSVE